eukprot:TRINITY_DN2512_c1_g4_i1.p1 TRINITY_DN2512_c1_g4~~TRINITY_DN2512_c1_g4_i1.p1  ORF type:complete len:154 (-),score=47.20 TRINITY_DN2512_c1_g4_i1:65-526(-)
MSTKERRKSTSSAEAPKRRSGNSFSAGLSSFFSDGSSSSLKEKRKSRHGKKDTAHKKHVFDVFKKKDKDKDTPKVALGVTPQDKRSKDQKKKVEQLLAKRDAERQKEQKVIKVALHGYLQEELSKYSSSKKFVFPDQIQSPHRIPVPPLIPKM